MVPRSHPSLERPTRVRYWVIVFAVALAVITYIDRVCISFAAPAIREELHLDAKQLGWVFLIFNWSYAVFEIPGGFLGDRIGPRKVLMRIVMWWSFFTAATGWTWNYGSLLFTRFMFGAGEAGCFPNLTKIYTIWLPEKERVRAQGIMWLSARWGGAFTPPLVALVMGLVSPTPAHPEFGWRRAFSIFGCLGVIWAVVFFKWFRDNPFDKPKMNAAERDLIRQDMVTAATHVHVPWGRLIRSKQVWMLCWQYFCLSYGWYFYVTWLPTYLKEARHLDLSSMAMLSIWPLFAGGLANPVSVAVGNWLVRRNGNVVLMRRIMACIGFTGASGFLIYSTRFADPNYAVAAIALASFCNDLVMPHAWASAMDIGGKYAGTISGAMNFWGNVGGGLGPLMIGYILSWTDNDWNLTFYVSAAIYFLGSVFWLLLDPVTPLDDPESAGLHAPVHADV
jgi:ACS family glucarate transporter-like MFS transporter